MAVEGNYPYRRASHLVGEVRAYSWSFINQETGSMVEPNVLAKRYGWEHPVETWDDLDVFSDWLRERGVIE